MNKRLFALLVAAVSSATPLMADEETVDGYKWTYGIDGDEARIDSVTPEPAGAVTIPSMLGGKPMTRIGSSAFSGCTNMTSVTIPVGVKKIGESAFYGCSSLTNMVIPDGVKKINSSVFRDCSGLLSVEIPSSVTNIGSSAFSGCSGLTSVSIPTSVVEISSSAFSKCDGLRSVTIPQCVCSSTMKTIFPAAYRSITNVVISDGVTEIGSSAFSDCKGLTSLSIPASVTKIGWLAFSKRDGLRSVTIPQCVCSSKMKTIFPAAYQSITNVVIADGVTQIGSSAFSGCNSLINIAIPDSVTSVGDGAFSGCNDLIFDTTTLPGLKLVDGWAVGYTASLPKELDLTGVRGIGEKIFFDCDELVSVTLPAGVTSIGASAFYGCNGLTSVTIPASVTSIGEKAFSSCWGLMKIVFEGDAPDVASSAFSSVRSSCTVYVPKDSSGWGVEIPGKWNKLRIAYIVEGVVDGGRLDPTFAKAQTVQGALIRYDKYNSLVGTVQVKVGRVNARKRTARLSAVATLLVNGKAKRFTAKAVTVTVDASQRIPSTTLTFKVNNRIMSSKMKFEMGADGVFTLASPSHAMAQATVGGALQGGARGTFRLEEFDLAVPGTLQDDLLPSEEPFDVVGSQWKFAQPATVKWTQNRETKEYGRVVDESRGKTNHAGLKLNYAAKTGIFKGSFKAYSLQDAPGGKKMMKKLKVDVIGFVVDGFGTGEASCRRPAGGPWAVTIE